MPFQLQHNSASLCPPQQARGVCQRLYAEVVSDQMDACTHATLASAWRAGDYGKAVIMYTGRVVKQ